MSSNRSSRLRACCTVHSRVGFAVALPSRSLLAKAQVSHSIEYSSVQGHVQVQLPGHRAGSISRPWACQEILADVYLWTSNKGEVI